MVLMDIRTPEIVSFHRAITDYYYQSGRHDMPWRRPDESGNFDPYRILISEIMLQQTQVDRVMPKYAEFLQAFPDVQRLAASSLGDVLTVWNGLGYNRRAKYVWQAAGLVVSRFDGMFPETAEELQQIPGIGPNTAGAIMAYAYNQPVVFVETNIRTVILHHFFADQMAVHDRDIRDVLGRVLPGAPGSETSTMQGAILGPRQFYWALMDYGTYLKKTVGNVSRASKHYARQSTFQGSLRQLRGRVIKSLTAGETSKADLQQQLGDERLDDVLDALVREGLVAKKGKRLRLGSEN